MCSHPGVLSGVFHYMAQQFDLNRSRTCIYRLAVSAHHRRRSCQVLIIPRLVPTATSFPS